MMPHLVYKPEKKKNFLDINETKKTAGTVFKLARHPAFECWYFPDFEILLFLSVWYFGAQLSTHGAQVGVEVQTVGVSFK